MSQHIINYYSLLYLSKQIILSLIQINEKFNNNININVNILLKIEFDKILTFIIRLF